ncbi:MAG: 1-deoxy-D-xylulose-5-phosphate reductoisomerase [Alicyclobacillus herbarius]|uniref:1-deoxy-D-xylulose-5-phosphate reductoisomerase n=1 Tax=Alicyclobacillus herbarius TaxID=122960 RepID=UPI002355D2B0|nr:1-deoxy-D-xylulose-5-phosphate reductoisomerase [Alicyclobacillus herbarius]MCL6632007.1 1-deoxy-D-xylulose-5-phosphate reductoisomerase [Alicyclobacillus herbarius]
MGEYITILGSTGVIGRLTLEVLESLEPAFQVRALAAGRNVDRLAEQVQKWRPEIVSVADDEAGHELIGRLRGMSPLPTVVVGDDGLKEVASADANVVVSAIVGAKGLVPTWIALARGAKLALANKETLVAAGDLVIPHAARHAATIVPVDSEHAAVHQCLRSGHDAELAHIWLTASGGPFRTWERDRMRTVRVEDALAHPNWSMGKKITVDSATLMNKGLEVIEAHHLFAVSYDKIKVVVHPQSIIHSLVEFCDGSMVAQMGPADMRMPIQYALTYPERKTSVWPRLNLMECGPLSFESPDWHRFPSLRLAYEAGRSGGLAPCILNAANEVAVAAFLAGRISFLEIPELVERVLDAEPAGTASSLEEVLEADARARVRASALVERSE